MHPKGPSSRPRGKSDLEHPKGSEPPITAAAHPAPAASSPAPPSPVAPFFRRIDWLAFLLTALSVWLGYYLTLAPEVTLADSGELVTGSFYAGIPHAPGYPVWTIYSWLWTVLVPWGNIAWRVALAEAFAGAIACGLIALLVSRGSSLLIESLEALRSLTGKRLQAIGFVSAFVAGLLVGFDGFMWRQSVAVDRIAVASVPVFLLVLVLLLRWIYAPARLRYAAAAAFIFGLCYTMHQSLIVAALGFEVTLAAGNARLGRDAFLGNFILYLLDWLVYGLGNHQHVFQNIGAKPGLFFLFNAVGLGSLLACVWLTYRTKGLGAEWRSVLLLAVLWFAGIAFYLYLPISGMTNPPMQWAYPRTVDGFWHALTRGQYEQPNPTNIFGDPLAFLGQLKMLVEGIADEFTWVYMLLALVPFFCFLRLQKRERGWLASLSAMYLLLGVLMMILMNPTPDRASRDLIKVFFNSSHTIVACFIGYGLALTAAFMAAQYGRFRGWALAGGAAAVVLALVCLWNATGRHYFGPAGQVNLWSLPHWLGQAFARNQYGLPIFANLILVALAGAFVAALLLYRRRAPLLLTLTLFTAMPLYSVLAHWFDSEQRHHWFGYWFGHDMFTPPFKGSAGQPLYPAMTKDAILFGGTDPGRFCPTYMIFCESFIPHHCQPRFDQEFDRRDVYIITQNALADLPYLNYIRAHYNRSQQLDPPFFQELCRLALRDGAGHTNLLARAVQPLDRFFTRLGDRVEARRRVGSSWFTENDFLDLPKFAARLRPGPEQDPLSKYLFGHLSLSTTRLLLSGAARPPALRRALMQDLNRLLKRELETKRLLAKKQAQRQELETTGQPLSARARRRYEQLGAEIAELSELRPLYDADRFPPAALSLYLADFVKENPQGHSRIRLNRLLLEAAYPRELARSLGGVYPDREIRIPSAADALRCTLEYTQDAARRMQLNQLEPGEIVTQLPDGRVQIHGQISVMAANGLLAKVMFDQNPDREFFVEESLPIKWMYPYLSPYGIIMKLNHQPPAELGEDVVKRDHEFWERYSARLIGDWITYDTSVPNLVAWAQRLYLRRDFTGFTGDRRFIRDEAAQKAFAKLRTALAGLYLYRMAAAKTIPEQQRMAREAEFALRQAFALCPYSLELLARYVPFLANAHRFDDALRVARTCLQLDPYNDQVVRIVNDIERWKKEYSDRNGSPKPDASQTLQQLERTVRDQPANFQAAFDLAGNCLLLQQTNRAVEILDRVLHHPQLNYQAAIVLAQAFAQIHDYPRLQAALQQSVRLAPELPEAWCNLAAFHVFAGNTPAALDNLRRALQLSAQRRQQDPQAPDLAAEIKKDPRFTPLLQRPEAQQLLAPGSNTPPGQAD